jgi:hypothetical protein
MIDRKCNTDVAESDMSNQLCLTCAYWFQVRVEGPGVPGIAGSAAQGECKRYAPHPSVGSGHRHVLWPLTSAPDMCGEWEARAV